MSTPPPAAPARLPVPTPALLPHLPHRDPSDDLTLDLARSLRRLALGHLSRWDALVLADAAEQAVAGRA